MFQYSEKFRGNCVFHGKRKLLKNPECKSTLNTGKIYRANSVFQDKPKLLKTPEWQTIYVWYGEFRAHSVFQDKHEVAQKSWMIKIYSIQRKISGQTLFFRIPLPSLMTECTWFLYWNGNNLTTEHRTILYIRGHQPFWNWELRLGTDSCVGLPLW